MRMVRQLRTQSTSIHGNMHTRSLLQPSQWIDPSVQKRFEPFSACAQGHVASEAAGRVGSTPAAQPDS